MLLMVVLATVCGQKLLTELRNNGDQRDVEMLYTDLASNDFSTLFRMMQGFEGNPDEAYQKNLDKVYVHGCGNRLSPTING